MPCLSDGETFSDRHTPVSVLFPIHNKRRGTNVLAPDAARFVIETSAGRQLDVDLIPVVAGLRRHEPNAFLSRTEGLSQMQIALLEQT